MCALTGGGATTSFRHRAKWANSLWASPHVMMGPSHFSRSQNAYRPSHEAAYIHITMCTVRQAESCRRRCACVRACAFAGKARPHVHRQDGSSGTRRRL
jgi:hypothetical protein